LPNYSAAGVHTLAGTGDDGWGGATSLTWSVTVTNVNRAPTAGLAASPTNGVLPLVVQFTASGNDPDADVLTYGWAFGDGSTNAPQAGATVVAHEYVAPGTCTAVVTVNDGLGGTATANATVRVRPWSTGFGPGAGGQPYLDFLTATGWVYTVEYRNDLTGTNAWQALTNCGPGSGGVLNIVIDTGLATQRFFRAKGQR
jgi:PKD repeat protein